MQPKITNQLTVTAKFTGTHGSMGYRKGHLYKLLVETKYFGHSIYVIPVGRQLWGPQSCPYANMQKFLENWQVVKVG